MFVCCEVKENNFKVILVCIWDLMNIDVSVLEWLYDVFLGYGDFFVVVLLNIYEVLYMIDFKDIFLDE